MTETGPPQPEEADLSAEADQAERRRHARVYQGERETFRAHQINGPDDGPASADFLVRRDSDSRYGGYIVDLARDGGHEAFGPDDLRYEAYDDCGRYVASTSSLPGALSVFAHPDRGFRWISDRMADVEFEPGA